MAETKTRVSVAHSERAGEFVQAHENCEGASLSLQLAPDDVTLQTTVTNACCAREVARQSVVDGLDQRARSIEGRSQTHDRVIERLRILSLRWLTRTTPIEAPKKWDDGVWAKQYEFIAAVEVAVAESDAEARLQETLDRFPVDFVCSRKTRTAPVVEWRDGAWYLKHSRGRLEPDTLSKAARRGKLTSDKVGRRRRYPVAGVCQLHPDCATLLLIFEQLN